MANELILLSSEKVIPPSLSCRTTKQHVEKVLRKQQPSGRGWHQENTRPEERSSRWMLWVPPIAVVQEPFDILPSCLQHPFDVHFLQTSEAKSRHVMPLLGFPE